MSTVPLEIDLGTNALETISADDFQRGNPVLARVLSVDLETGNFSNGGQVTNLLHIVTPSGSGAVVSLPQCSSALPECAIFVKNGSPGKSVVISAYSGDSIDGNGNIVVPGLGVIGLVKVDSNDWAVIQNTEPPIGTQRFFAGTGSQPGWISQNGGAVSRVDYSGLFAVINTIYGAGDGSSTFNLPAMQQMNPNGVVLIKT